MNKPKQRYVPPTADVVEVAVEKGYASTTPQWNPNPW